MCSNLGGVYELYLFDYNNVQRFFLVCQRYSELAKFQRYALAKYHMCDMTVRWTWTIRLQFDLFSVFCCFFPFHRCEMFAF